MVVCGRQASVICYGESVHVPIKGDVRFDTPMKVNNQSSAYNADQSRGRINHAFGMTHMTWLINRA